MIQREPKRTLWEREQAIRKLLADPKLRKLSVHALATLAGTSWAMVKRVRREVQGEGAEYYQDTQGRHQPARHQSKPFSQARLKRMFLEALRRSLISNQAPTLQELKSVCQAVLADARPLLTKPDQDGH